MAGTVADPIRAYVDANENLSFVPFLEQDGGGIKAKGGACGERVGFGSTFAAADASAREGGGGRFVHAHHCRPDRL